MSINEILNIIQIAIIIAGGIGGFLAFVRTRRNDITQIQATTITALKQKVDVIESKLRDLQQENEYLQTVIETIKEALKEQGISIYTEGRTVVIENLNKRPPRKSHRLIPRDIGKSSPALELKKDDPVDDD